MKQEIQFIKDIPGFAGLQKFTLDTTEEQWPFGMLQSTDKEEVGFIVADPYVFFSNYEVDLSDDLLADLHIVGQEEVQIWNIITYKNSIAESTMNLQAPVIMNTRTCKAAQVIFSSSPYSVRQPLTPSVQAIEAGEKTQNTANEPQGGDANARANKKKR